MIKKYWKDAIFYIALIVLFLFLGTAEVKGMSMYPTYKDGDFLIMWRTHDVSKGDIVSADLDILDEILCKRVIGTSGDHIVIDDGKLYVNDELQQEEYINEQEWGKDCNIDITLGEHELFLMGDNRNNSSDSRELGIFNDSEVKGKFLFNVTAFCGLRRVHLKIIACCILVLITARYFIDNKDSNKSEVSDMKETV